MTSWAVDRINETSINHCMLDLSIQSSSCENVQGDFLASPKTKGLSKMQSAYRRSSVFPVDFFGNDSTHKINITQHLQILHKLSQLLKFAAGMWEAINSIHGKTCVTEFEHKVCTHSLRTLSQPIIWHQGEEGVKFVIRSLDQ